MMLGQTTNVKKGSSKFEDSDSRMTRPRAVPGSELPQRPLPRLNAAPGSESCSGVPRRPVGVRGTAPRSPLHEKKPAGAGPAGAGAGAGSRVIELEAELEKAHAQLTEMREQLTAAEKARKEARSALVEAKKRCAAKKWDDVVATSAVHGYGDNEVLALAAEAADVEAVADDDEGAMISLAIDVLDAVVPSEPENNNEEEAKNTTGKEEGNRIISNGNEKMWSQEVDELRAKLMAKDMEVYKLRAKLMVRATEVDELRETLTAKNTELDDLRGKLASNDTVLNKLTANLMLKDADIAALEADHADLTRMAEEASEAVKATTARARETEHGLRESAAREARVAEQLRSSERAREALEAEAQRSRAQRERWRNVAEEAADSVDKQGHTSDGVGERAAKSAEEDGASGKRKPGAMRALRDLWKKKAQR